MVVLDQVIEHVQNQTSVLNEALRVLKPGGAIYVACPNYLRFYEPHYKVLFFPLLPKFLASFYLRMRRRDPVLLRQLTYTTNRRVRRLLRKLNLQFMDLNERGFLDKCMGQTSRAATKKARAVQLLRACQSFRSSFLSPLLLTFNCAKVEVSFSRFAKAAGRSSNFWIAGPAIAG
ncbi:MAG TPA: methyltransferase domain-containing protein [Terriglobales bacterium]|nr:methyltransferase domain-containing protein [Terriglobales bacterium]